MQKVQMGARALYVAMGRKQLKRNFESHMWATFSARVKNVTGCTHGKQAWQTSIPTPFLGTYPWCSRVVVTTGEWLEQTMPESKMHSSVQKHESRWENTVLVQTACKKYMVGYHSHSSYGSTDTYSWVVLAKAGGARHRAVDLQIWHAHTHTTSAAIRALDFVCL